MGQDCGCNLSTASTKDEVGGQVNHNRKVEAQANTSAPKVQAGTGD